MSMLKNSLFLIFQSQQTEFLDNHRVIEPPDPIPNSEVKSDIADGSVGVPM